MLDRRLRIGYSGLMTRCEDYPCCGHTDNDPCPVTHEYDYDDMDGSSTPWCYGCDNFAKCGDYAPDGADIERWETTTPNEAFMTDEGYVDREWEDQYRNHSSSITGIYESY